MLFTTSLLATASLALAAPLSDLEARAFSFPIPDSKGSVTYSSAHRINDTFDGGYKTYDRGVSCTGDAEGGDSDAVFLLEDGATLKNAIIGVNQIEGVHCLGACTIENVWWTDVCEDALTIKGDGDATVTGGGARNADDKIVQHNGIGTVTIDGFHAETFENSTAPAETARVRNGKARNVIIRNVEASDGSVLAGINSNYGDTAKIESSTCATKVDKICSEYTGNNNGDEPPLVSSGPSSKCIYDTISAC